MAKNNQKQELSISSFGSPRLMCCASAQQANQLFYLEEDGDNFWDEVDKQLNDIAEKAKEKYGNEEDKVTSYIHK